MTLTVPATPLLCMRTEAGQLLVEIVYNDYVTALRKHPAAGIGFIPIPCFYGIIVSIHYCEGGRQMASTKGSSPLTKGPSVLLQSGAKV